MNDKQEKLRQRIAKMEGNKVAEETQRQEVFDNREKRDALRPGETEFSKEYEEEEVLFTTPIDKIEENDEKGASVSVSGKKGDSKKKKKAKKFNLFGNAPKTAQETIPYLSVYKNGIIEISENVFSKSYVIGDVNFSIASDEEQENIFMNYGKLLNMFGEKVTAQITIFNRNVDIDKFKKNVLLKLKGDGLDKYRLENNAIMEMKIGEGKNNITHEKYLTLSLEAENIDAAIKAFSKLDNEVSTFIKKINNVDTQPMTLEERLSVLY
ncbi:MAG: hypothetical protein II305_02085, partial [Clostridia bacterium]|nr:hypothetical protein [Clostridia bacterium]